MNITPRSDGLVAERSAEGAGEAGVGTIAHTLADFAVRLDWDDVPEAVRERAKLHMLDCVGIALASTGFDFARRLLSSLGRLSGPGENVVIGRSERLSLRDAVLANGSLVHGLDFDDTHSEGVIHASASAFPVALGLAEARRASGRELLLAYLAGVEGAVRIASAARGKFHLMGFHPTGMVGVFGGCLAAGRLADATAAQVAGAQGVALSMASGSLEFLADGSWTKRIHPGFAGASAVLATELARDGFKAPPLAYEGRYGLFRSHLAPDAEPDLARCTAGLGEVWEMERVALKPFPACHFNHAFADAALALKRAHGVSLDDVAAVRVRIGEGQAGVVCEPQEAKRRPQNSYDAQFSVHYAVAASLKHGRFTLDELEEEAIADPDVRALMSRISYEIDPHSRFPEYYSGEVEIETADGRVLTHREDMNRGSAGNPLSPAEVVAKFEANAGRALAPRAVDRIRDAVLALEEEDDAAAFARGLSA